MYPSPFKVISLCLFVLVSLNTSAQQWRVKAKINELSVVQGGVAKYSIVDSTDYYYSYQSNRGSNINNTKIDYDVSSEYRGQSGGGLGLGAQVNRTYNNNDQVLTEQYFTNIGGVWKSYREDTLTYSGGNLVSRKTYGNFSVSGAGAQWILKTENKYTYNAKNLLILLDIYDFRNNVGVPLTNISKQYFDYNSNGQQILDSLRVLRGSTFIVQEVFNLNYNANGDLITEFENRVSLGYGYKHFYTYNSAGLKIRDSMATIGLPSDPIIYTYGYNSAGLLISDTIFYNSGIIISINLYTYTSFGRISSHEVVRNTASTGTTLEPYRKTRYRYEAYFPVSVKQRTTVMDDKLTLYPNPAHNVLQIDSKVVYENGHIYNNNGQLVKTIKRDEQQIDISTLPAGNYYLQLQADGKHVSKPFVIAR